MIGKVWKRFAAAFVAVAVVFSTVGHALEKGWEWENVAQCSAGQVSGCWPAGTTVELCVNGQCIPGLDGATMPTAQYRMDMLVDHGDVIHGKARAVAPEGYQCGDQPVPCPYSDWSNNVVLTYPPPPSGFTYQLEKRNAMAAPTYGMRYRLGGGTPVVQTDTATPAGSFDFSAAPGVLLEVCPQNKNGPALIVPDCALPAHWVAVGSTQPALTTPPMPGGFSGTLIRVGP